MSRLTSYLLICTFKRCSKWQAAWEADAEGPRGLCPIPEAGGRFTEVRQDDLHLQVRANMNIDYVHPYLITPNVEIR